jgi:CubicO group peptidase (beta-lactamase class C family)
MPVRGERKITLEDLATHRSGLPRLPDNLNPADPTNPYADYTPQLLLEFLAGYKLTREPAKEFEYSNLGMGLLGYLLAEKQNKSYEQLLRERIAAPLKMTDTVIKLDAAQRARLAPPHDGDGRAGKNWDLPTLAGAGAIRSTAADLLRFAQANIKTPEGELGQAIELAWRVHQEPLKGGPFAVGLGWHIARDGSTRWHNGQTGGYHSMLLVRREQQLAVVLLTNSGTGDVDALAEDIMRMLAGATVKPRAIDKPIDVAADVMQSYEGKYELVPGAVFTVAVDGKKLMVGLTGQPAFEVYARSKTEWFYKVVKATLTFKVDGDGKCNAVELFQNGIHKTAKRVE